jgi:NAD(P)-dependent dehydrogenase (short-subunit alcohol dehydrogenase family)
MKCAALEYANQNIRINAINPGATSTPMIDTFLNGSSEYAQTILDKQPSGAIATPENCAKAAVWLCADFNDQIIGITLPIDGGFSAGKY